MSQSCLALHIFLIKEKQKEIIPAGRTNTCPWVSMHLGWWWQVFDVLGTGVWQVFDAPLVSVVGFRCTWWFNYPMIDAPAGFPAHVSMECEAHGPLKTWSGASRSAAQVSFPGPGLAGKPKSLQVDALVFRCIVRLTIHWNHQPKLTNCIDLTLLPQHMFRWSVRLTVH